MNKEGTSSGFLFIIALIAIFVSGIMYVILNQVYTNYLFNQTTVDQVLNTFPNANATAVSAAQTTAGYFWYSIPIFIIIMIVLYVFVKAQSGNK